MLQTARMRQGRSLPCSSGTFFSSAQIPSVSPHAAPTGYGVGGQPCGDAGAGGEEAPAGSGVAETPDDGAGSAEFEAADAWRGSKPGWFFGTGELGTGYYRDSMELVAEPAAQPVPATPGALGGEGAEPASDTCIPAEEQEGPGEHYWGQALQTLDTAVQVRPGKSVSLLVKREPNRIRFSLRQGVGEEVERPPWKETWGGGASIENPHVQRVHYCELLVRACLCLCLCVCTCVPVCAWGREGKLTRAKSCRDGVAGKVCDAQRRSRLYGDATDQGVVLLFQYQCSPHPPPHTHRAQPHRSRTFCSACGASGSRPSRRISR